MNKIFTYDEFISEELLYGKIDIDEINKVVAKLYRNVNSDVIEKLNKYKDKFLPFLKKYTKDGKILLFKILKDANQNISESSNRGIKIGGDFNYQPNKPNKKSNIFSDFLKIFSGLFNVNIFVYGLLVGAIGVFICASSMLIHNIIDHRSSGIEKGVIVSDIKFEEAHDDFPIVEYVSSNGSTDSYNFTEHVPDTWMFEVKDIESDRIERWSTTNKELINNIEKGDTLSSDDFKWDFTIKE